MPLAPDAAALLAAIGQSRPAFETLTADEARGLSSARRSARVEGPAMECVRDVLMAGPDGPITLRVYRPHHAQDPSPAVVYFHGGGWVIGDLDSHDATCRRLAGQSLCTVIAVDYRLAPEHRWPAAADDADASVRWIVEHASALQVDADRVAVAGDSAGANLAAVVARRFRDAGAHAPTIRFQLLIYPLTDARCLSESWSENVDGPFVSAASMRWFWHQYLGDASGDDPDASPLRAQDLRGLPAALVITAEHDVLRDEGEAYAAAMADASVCARSLRFDGVFHGFFGFVDQLDAARRANSAAASALVRALGSTSPCHVAPLQ